MVVLVTLAEPAFAGEPPTDAASKFALAWVRDDGAESCPAGHDFADEVTRRLGRSPFDERAPRSIEIRVEREATEFRSRVLVRERDGSVTGRRVLSSPDCAALFSATALAVALVIDPDTMLRGDATATQATAVFERPEPAQKPPSTQAAPPARAAGAATPDNGTATSPPPRARRERASASLNAALTLGLLPQATPGVELRVLARAGAHWQIGAGALYATTGTVTAEGASFGVGLTAFSLSGLLAFAETTAVGVGAEAGVWAGALHVTVRPDGNGSAVTPTHPGDFPFLAASGGLYLRGHLSEAWFLDARALGLISLVRRELEVTGAGSPVWTEPVVGALMTAGLGVEFF
jgi:hypothetical protein